MQSFEAVSQLGVEALRALLRDGDPQERVWAAWSLALRLGGEAVPDLDLAARASPAAGTRRHLIVSLAGLGERALLFTFAEADPHDLVRATACRYLMKTWSAGDGETAEFVLGRLLADSAPDVKGTILREARDGLPPARLEQLVGLASDHALEVRRLAFDLIKHRHDPGDAASGALLGRLREETDRDLLANLAAFCLDGGAVGEVLRAAIDSMPPARLLLLEVMLGQGETVSWSQAERLAALGEVTVDQKLIHLLGREALCDGFPWLARTLATRTPDQYGDLETRYFNEALTPFAEAIDRVPGARLTERCREDLTRLSDFLRKEIAELAANPVEEPDDLGFDWIAGRIASYEELAGKIGGALRR